MRSISSHPARDDANRAELSGAIIAQFRTALRELRCMGGDRMRKADISSTNFHILSMLDRHGEMAMGRLADKLDVSLSNASGLIDRLEDRGFVERIRVPDDRRIVIVRATDLGRSTLVELEVLKDGMVQSLLDQLGATQLERVALALEDIRTAASAVFAADPELSRHEHGHDHANDHSHPATLVPPTGHDLASGPVTPA
jgi:MarR family transcriptional regulator, organic hydroperoxide resistance regulator